ncbi:MAG TPA: hydantoinase/oxoprolinase family protein [Solirubrobacterales bacterium]|jgi:N-methylhydantoinase A/acetone carboxylase beta subunit|nr:hydantoinase/oxoprolinase family protein [Solirubrobacterales bacterium]HEX2467387.1 hydantoinase/oxoprolinase family protein [Solirubrobacterales bacterium]
MSHTPRVFAIDAGGTMTDTFIVDEAGEFIVGKAQTTPEDESVGLMASTDDAFKQWGMDTEAGLPEIRSGVFSGTAMLNRLLSRKGLNLGMIVTAGQEDSLRMERAIQTYLGFSYGDRLHVATHYHNDPLVDRDQVRGVRGRIDLYGTEALPLREADVREAAAALLDAGVDGIVVSLLFSYRNPAHEARVGEILAEEKASRGLDGDCPVFLSSELYPTRRDVPRMNSTVIEAYAAEPSRGTLRRVAARTRERGAGFELRVMASHGGTISIDAKELGTTLISGPIGGVVGAQWLAERIGLSNVLCTDIGGTSFDIALITDGRYEVTPTPDMARFVLNMPLVKIDSIGAGCGSFVRVDPSSHRPELGPDSAGARVGVCNPEGGLETISISDLNLVLGRLNPDYFLGGEVVLDVDRARDAISKQIAKPLGLSVEDASAGIIELFETTLRGEAVGRVLGKGYSPTDYTLLCYGGGGPLHVAGYTAGVPYANVLVPAWAAGFSAFGCACADFEYRYDRTVDLPLPPNGDAEARAGIGALVTEAWKALEERVATEFAKSGYDRDQVRFVHAVRMQYYGQLNDIEIDSPHAELETADQVDELVARFEDEYGKVYASSAKSPELGYVVTQAIVKGSVEIEKPRLPELDVTAGSPPVKHTRPVHWGADFGFTETDVYEMHDVVNGHTIEGPAVIEAPSTTFAIPPDRRAWVDAHDIFHLENKEADR